ncbi:PP2C family protein-serine/threonine phosphatase [Jatrophihabitans sp.]|uniref:PP2C family protein-serine/threonine phosphatase n=1 Tax=Jatrophihabitans sp. TaxID=1932789 RepID=UPI0030C65B89|nr:hypothetical protein [Jatrophihabitans sp.]
MTGDPAPPARGARWLRSPVSVALGIALISLAVTGVVSSAAWHLDHSNEHRLLEVQTKQAAALVGAAVTGIEAPLQDSLDIAAATHGRASKFRQYIASSVGPAPRIFVSASLWKAGTASPTLITTVGARPAAATSAATIRMVGRAVHSKTFLVTNLSSAGGTRIGFALADPANPGYVVYAERTVPANRRVPVESDSAFSELDYATYLGPTESAAALATTDVAPNRLPLSGSTVRVAIPFGDTVITLVTSARGHLAGTLAAQLWWILLIGGLLLSAVSTTVGGALARGRRQAELAAETNTALYERLDALYGEQRTISETLQHALLPQTNPVVPELEIASRYVAGAQGVEVGGDWYSLVAIDDRHFAFVVGDVSGRGVPAAAIMARIRFTLRAYLVEGHAPERALQMSARQLDITVDGHMATVIVGVGDLAARQVTVANAGHPLPLLVTPGGASFLPMPVGRPLGVGGGTYVSTTFTMPAGSTLLAFTDGLVERRDEDLDLGMARLAAAAGGPPRPLDTLLVELLATMTQDGSDDDIAMLAFRWRDPA